MATGKAEFLGGTSGGGKDEVIPYNPAMLGG